LTTALLILSESRRRSTACSLSPTVCHMILKRLVDVVLLWLVVGAAIVVFYAVTAQGAKLVPRSDAKIPTELLPGEWRGSTVEEVVEWFNRNHPECAMPPDVIE
jgi:hypothetical protein